MYLTKQTLKQKAAFIVLPAFFTVNILVSPGAFAAEPITFESGEYQPVIALADLPESMAPQSEEIAKDETSLQSESPLSAPDEASTSDVVRTSYYEISAISTSSSSMTVSGHLLIGGTTGTITEVYVRYRPAGTTEYAMAAAPTTTTAFSKSITGLKANTHYEIQVIIPSKGLSSEILNVKTLAEQSTISPATKATITTPVISNITSSSADINLNVTGSSAPVTLFYTNTTTGIGGSVVMSKAIESSSYFAQLKSLSAGTYTVYAEIVETGKDPVRSATRQFQITSVPEPSTAKVGAPVISNITETTATVNVTVTGAPLASTIVLSYKNLSTGITSLLSMINQGNGHYMAPLKSLASGTSYEIQAKYSETGKPDVVSNKITFKTVAQAPITITAPAVTNITTTRADVRVSVGEAPASAGVVLYYKNLTTGAISSMAMTAGTNGSYTASLNSLTHETNYEIYAQVNVTGRNPEKSQTVQFKTSALPPITIAAPSITNITSTGAEIKVNVTGINTGARATLTYKNLSTGLTNTVNMSVAASVGNFAAALNNLGYDTNYEFTIQVIDSGRTITSGKSQFKTAPNIITLSPATSSITPHSAKVTATITGILPSNAQVQIRFWISGQPTAVKTTLMTRSGNSASATITDLRAETNYEYEIVIVSGTTTLAKSDKKSFKTADDIYVLHTGSVKISTQPTGETAAFNVSTNWPLPAGFAARVVLENPRQVVAMTATAADPTRFSSGEVRNLGGTYLYHFEIVDTSGRVISTSPSSSITVTSISVPVVTNIQPTSATFTVTVKGNPAGAEVYLYYRSLTTGISGRITLPHTGNGIYTSPNNKIFESGNDFEVYAVIMKGALPIISAKTQFHTPAVSIKVVAVSAKAVNLTGSVLVTAKTDLQIPAGYSVRAIFYDPVRKPIVQYTAPLTSANSLNFNGSIVLPTGHTYAYRIELLDKSGKLVSTLSGSLLVPGPVV